MRINSCGSSTVAICEARKDAATALSPPARNGFASEMGKCQSFDKYKTCAVLDGKAIRIPKLFTNEPHKLYPNASDVSNSCQTSESNIPRVYNCDFTLPLVRLTKCLRRTDMRRENWWENFVFGLRITFLSARKHYRDSHDGRDHRDKRVVNFQLGRYSTLVLQNLSRIIIACLQRDIWTCGIAPAEKMYFINIGTYHPSPNLS